MGNKGWHLVIRGKPLGKTKIVKTLADKACDDAALLYVRRYAYTTAAGVNKRLGMLAGASKARME